MDTRWVERSRAIARWQPREHDDDASDGNTTANGKGDLHSAHERRPRRVRQQGAGGTTDTVCHSQSAAERSQDGVCSSDRYVAASKGRGHVVLVAGRHDATDDGDSKRAADLEGHGIGR